MKKILYTILKTVMLLPLLAACSSETDSFLSGTGTEGNAIVLQFSTGDTPLSRATVPSEEGAEVAVEHLDVFIFEESGGKKHYERVTGCTNKEGTVTLAAKREDFAADTGYWVYLIANSTHATTEFDAIADLNSLKAMTQQDRDIFLTGLGDISEAPQSFLMDGIAYADAQEPAAAAPVVLYNGVKSDDTKLKVTLRRAAAKVIVHIKKGEKVTFDQELEGAIPGYYLRNMPYTTSLLAGVGGEADLRTPGLVNTDYFDWTAEQITVTAYAYAHEWADASLEKEVRLVVNIPMRYTDESGNETEYVSSYYQIPISEHKVLERNTCYQVTVTVNAPGALDPSEPEELTDIQYSVKNWENINVDINGDDRPIFLYVNEEEMEMHNITEDNTTLEFASSSSVEAKITRVYYIDKFGQEQDLKKIADTDNDYGISTGVWWPTWNNRCTIKITPDEGINGKLDVYSTLPENNTIRYIDFDVTNADGITRKVTVAQYPLEYITNIQGWYSYRSDFGGTTWENYRNPTNKRVSAYNYNKNNDTWGYSATGYGQDYTFTSKVANEITSGNNKGKSKISYYYYRNSSTRLSTEEIWSAGNARMYYVRITASSGDYTVGRPKITENGITDPGTDNAELVSPSFMIASQLGAVFEISSVEMAASHCKQYVEVSKDGAVYDDWRLPTKAELEIIIKFQYKDNAAMDEVLSGEYYWSASGSVHNAGASDTSGDWVAIRCVRDAYETK
ncbi:hypothetical protein QUW55_11605 [Phocaeicola barnesiae]|uniref:fimbrial tip adhesin FimD n=1 Tax=Phocaeicola barnesiae TaxID=376804 RepID=UPI0025A3F5C7|nr:hypothetical protein [Phocaeicola barnesiae]MDM8252246.1 hypothetical protein [Phocaeicola barnesiae]